MIRKLMITAGILLLAAPLPAAEQQVLTTQKERVNYALGANMVSTLKQQGLELDLDLVIRGMKDAASGTPLLLSDDELRKAISLYQTTLRQKQAARSQKIIAESNKKAGETFLAENRKKDGVTVTATGLQYRVIVAGNGRKPTEADSVECHYRGALVNGTEFDSTYRSGKPATIKVREGKGIPGLREALQLMTVGSKWQIAIPPALAYGELGMGKEIGPLATLIFEVELLAVQ